MSILAIYGILARLLLDKFVWQMWLAGLRTNGVKANAWSLATIPLTKHVSINQQLDVHMYMHRCTDMPLHEQGISEIIFMQIGFSSCLTIICSMMNTYPTLDALHFDEEIVKPHETTA